MIPPSPRSASSSVRGLRAAVRCASGPGAARRRAHDPHRPVRPTRRRRGGHGAHPLPALSRTRGVARVARVGGASAEKWPPRPAPRLPPCRKGSPTTVWGPPPPREAVVSVLPLPRSRLPLRRLRRQRRPTRPSLPRGAPREGSRRGRGGRKRPPQQARRLARRAPPIQPFSKKSRTQQLQKCSKSASTTPQRPIWNCFATVGVRDFSENGCRQGNSLCDMQKTWVVQFDQSSKLRLELSNGTRTAPERFETVQIQSFSSAVHPFRRLTDS